MKQIFKLAVMFLAITLLWIGCSKRAEKIPQAQQSQPDTPQLHEEGIQTGGIPLEGIQMDLILGSPPDTLPAMKKIHWPFTLESDTSNLYALGCGTAASEREARELAIDSARFKMSKEIQRHYIPFNKAIILELNELKIQDYLLNNSKMTADAMGGMLNKMSVAQIETEQHNDQYHCKVWMRLPARYTAVAFLNALKIRPNLYSWFIDEHKDLLTVLEEARQGYYLLWKGAQTKQGG